MRPATILVASFIAGLACTAWLHGPTLLDPPPEPYFGLDADEPTAARAVPAATARAVKASTHQPVRPPERLALGPAAAPIVAVIESQAVPTSAGDDHGTVEQAAPMNRAAVEPAQATREDVGPSPAGTVPPTTSPPSAANIPVPTESLRALVDRVRQARAPAATPRQDAAEPVPAPTAKPPPLVLPHERVPIEAPSSDPPGAAADDAGGDGAATPRPAGRLFGLLSERRSEPQADDAADGRDDKPLWGGRLLNRVRGDAGPGRLFAGRLATVLPDRRPDGPPQATTGWPQPLRLFEQLEQLRLAARAAGEPAAVLATWAADTDRCLHDLVSTSAPGQPHAAALLAPLIDASRAGSTVADQAPTGELATLTRRAALAVGRRAATWQAATGVCAELAGAGGTAAGPDLEPQLAAGQQVAEVIRLLHALERYETTQAAADAHAAQAELQPLVAAAPRTGPTLVQAVTDQYMAPNIRIAIHRDFVARVLPEKTVTSGRMEDFVLGRPVRGTNTVEQSLAVGFLPSRNEIRLELRVNGAVSSRTVTDGGVADIHSRGTANFVVRKPIILTPRGIAFGTALGAASNSAQLAGIATPFDDVPLMGSMMQRMVGSRFEDSRDEAAREVNEKIINRACRQVDREAEPKLLEMAERLRERIWMPMVALGLEPTPVHLETTANLATVRLRLAAAGQLAAHTPRSRVPEAAILSLQVHESTLNNGCERLALAGRRLTVEELLAFVCRQLGLPPHVPPDLPEGVEVAFAADDPLRVECRDGLVRLRVALDTLQSGRRAWHDIVAHVAYRPVTVGMQVRLVREGKVKLSGPGQRGQLEIALRTIFGKIFPAERPVELLPATLVEHPRLADIEAVQAAAVDGWFSIGLAPRIETPPVAPPPPRRQAIGVPRPRRR